MPEPTSTTAGFATLASQAVAVPVLTAFGISLGLRVDVLLAGFCGSVAAMGLLNTVPSTGDSWRNLVRDTGKRFTVAVCSSLFAGYATPLLALINGIPPALLLSVAFVAGGGAQYLMGRLIAQTRTGMADRTAGHDVKEGS